MGRKRKINPRIHKITLKKKQKKSKRILNKKYMRKKIQKMR